MTTTAITPTQTAAVAAKPATKIGTFRDVLDKMKGQLALALPKHLDVDRMLRIVFTTVQRTPALLDCTQESLLGCIVQCAQLGLEPDGLLGHAYLIPFMNRKAEPKPRLECQLIIGYKGLLKLARQSGEIASVSARIVNQKDFFEYEYGLNEKLRHIPYMVKDAKDDAGLPIFAYAVFRLKDGSYHFDVMGFQEIEAIREASPSGKSPAWNDHWDEMAKKTVIRRASKMSPASVEDRMARAISLDERADAGLPQQLEDDDRPLALAASSDPALATPVEQGRRGPLRRPEATVDVPPSDGIPEDQMNEIIRKREAAAQADDRRGDDPLLDGTAGHPKPTTNDGDKGPWEK